MTIQAPYRFVPLSSLVVLPEWASQVTHDIPFKDGVCGELEIEITTHGKICVGGKQVVSDEDYPAKVFFYKTPMQQPAIPGASLKGMLRNVLEIATFSRFKQVEDQKLGVRDISENNFYTKAIVNNTQAGWLRFENHQWVIYPSQFARVHQKEIVQYFKKLTYQTWTKLKTVKQRYDHLGSICPNVSYKDSGQKKNGHPLVNLDQSSALKASLIMTGQPGAFYNENQSNEPQSAKKYEFIFYNVAEKGQIVPIQVMNGFRQIHEHTEEWMYWLKNLSNLEHGIPVFFHKNNQDIQSMGLAMMYKLVYKYSLHDAINHTSKNHLASVKNSADFADLIFGHLNQDHQHALKGRVNIGLATCTSNFNLEFTQATVLSSPKPTYYPHYIQQKDKEDFNQLMQAGVKLSGWKRYPLKQVVFPVLNKLVTTKVQVKLETVDRDCTFSSKIRLHNLRPVELGALLWCLDFGSHKRARHNIGMGKPYGLGQISLALKNSKLRLNNLSTVENQEVFLKACCLEFEMYMDKIVQQVNPSGSWMKTSEIKSLLEYADPENGLSLGYLSNPKEFANLRKKDNLSEFKTVFHDYTPLATNTEIQFSYTSQFDTQLELAKKMILAKHTKAKRERLKAHASPFDQIFYNLEDLIIQAEIEVTKTIKKKSNKEFKEPFEQHWAEFSDEQKRKFILLARQADKLIADNSLTKTVKKICVAE